jgi:Domain of unknown function (DUF4388)
VTIQFKKYGGNISMPMIGDLHSFALPDLLRTLGKSRQSGQLSVWSKDGVHRIWLAQGSVSTAIAPQPESVLKTLCMNVINPSHRELFKSLRPSTLSLSEPLGDWMSQKNWLTEDERSLIFQTQLSTGLYPLFELASGQFYFVADKVPLPYWEMTGLDIPAAEAISQSLDFVNSKTAHPIDLPSLELKFLTLASKTTGLRLSLLDRRLLQWFKQPNTIQSLCQVLNVEPIELQKACKRLLQLQLIAVPQESHSLSDPLPRSQTEQDISTSSQGKIPSEVSSLVERIAAVLNKPVLGKSRLVVD